MITHYRLIKMQMGTKNKLTVTGHVDKMSRDSLKVLIINWLCLLVVAANKNISDT